MPPLQVLPDGSFVKPPRDKMAYGSMVMTRVFISRAVVESLRRAVTIAVRYSAVRRQGQIEEG